MLELIIAFVLDEAVGNLVVNLDSSMIVCNIYEVVYEIVLSTWIDAPDYWFIYSVMVKIVVDKKENLEPY